MIYIAHPINDDQDKALKAIFEALKIPYESETDIDATTHLLSTQANKEALDESLSQIREGNTVKVTLDEIWK